MKQVVIVFKSKTHLPLLVSKGVPIEPRKEQ